VYTEIRDQAAALRVVTDYLADFNATSKKPMHLVIFQVRLVTWLAGWLVGV
jgi:dynein heavy chain